MAAKLLLFDSELREQVPTIATVWNIPAKQQAAIQSLADMAKQIGGHKTLEELIIFVHGFRGGMLVGGTAYDLDDAQVAKALDKPLQQQTVIDHIRFEGCWVGEDPRGMAAFGRIFGALRVSGFTWAHWGAPVTVTIPQGVSAAALETVLKSASGTTSSLVPWLAPNTPTVAQLASMARSRETKQTLSMEWFQYSLDEKPPYLNRNMERLGKHTYKVRGDAKQRSVKEKDATPSVDPTPPFEYVTVTLTANLLRI